MDIEVEKLETINRVVEALDKPVRDSSEREGALQSELDFWRLHRYARIVTEAVWPEKDPVGLTEMPEDFQLMAAITKWWEARQAEMREAEEIMAKFLGPGELPDEQRAGDIRSLVAGRMTMAEFRRRASE